MNTISRGVRNAFRNGIRSFSVILILSLAVGLCLVMLIAHQAVGQKIQDIKSSVGNTITIQPAGFSAYSQANNSLTSDQLNKVKSVAHVTSLTETLNDRITTIGASSFGGFGNNPANNSNQTSLTTPVTLNSSGMGGRFLSGGGSLPSNFSLPISVLGTTDPSNLNGSQITMSSGKMIDGSKDSNNALVSQAMATKNNLKIGSTFSAYNDTLTIAGIFNSSNRSSQNTVVVSLPTLQRLSGQSDDVTNAVATVDSADNLAAATTNIKNILGSSADIQNAQDQANNTIKPLQNVQSISLISLIGAVIAGSVIIFLVMLMIVRERKREIGVLKAIGASNFKVAGQFAAEAVSLTLAAAVIGIIIGAIAAGPITNTLVSNAASSTSISTTANGGRFGNGGGPRFAGFGSGGQGPVSRARGFGALRSGLSNIRATVGWSIILDGLATAVVIALIGSTLSSYLIAKVRPAEVMRTE
jgi:putative ABC transport system permease protein